MSCTQLKVVTHIWYICICTRDVCLASVAEASGFLWLTFVKGGIFLFSKLLP
jgi:hypothetical protein